MAVPLDPDCRRLRGAGVRAAYCGALRAALPGAVRRLRHRLGGLGRLAARPQRPRRPGGHRRPAGPRRFGVPGPPPCGPRARPSGTSRGRLRAPGRDRATAPARGGGRRRQHRRWRAPLPACAGPGALGHGAPARDHGLRPGGARDLRRAGSGLAGGLEPHQPDTLLAPLGEPCPAPVRIPDALGPPPAEAVVWGLLGPGRLHCTIATGAIISKTAAAAYTAARFPRWAELLTRARRWRSGAGDTRFTMADGLAACDLVAAVVGSVAGTPPPTAERAAGPR